MAVAFNEALDAAINKNNRHYGIITCYFNRRSPWWTLVCQNWEVGGDAGFCKVGLAKTGDTDARRRMISPSNKSLTIEEQCYALGFPHNTYYYNPLEGESDRNLEIMRKIDHQYMEHPAMGARQMVNYLKAEGFRVGRKLVRRLMALMDIKAIYPQKSLSKGGWIKYRMLYLLRNLDITHPNHVWGTDISYVLWNMALCTCMLSLMFTAAA